MTNLTGDDVKEQRFSSSEEEAKEAISEKSGEDGSEYESEEDAADGSDEGDRGSEEHKAGNLEDLDSSGLKVPAPGKDPFGLEPYDPKQAKREKKLQAKEEDMVEDLELEEKRLKKVQQKAVSNKKLRRCQCFQTSVRVLGAFIMVVDICCKYQYYENVRFVNKHLKETYRAFLFVRPLAITCILFYNFVIGLI